MILVVNTQVPYAKRPSNVGKKMSYKVWPAEFCVKFSQAIERQLLGNFKAEAAWILHEIAYFVPRKHSNIVVK